MGFFLQYDSFWILAMSANILINLAIMSVLYVTHCEMIQQKLMCHLAEKNNGPRGSNLLHLIS